MNAKAFLLASTIILSTAIVAFAHGGATGIVKERMDGMMAMGKALGSVGDMFKGKTKFNVEQVKAAADILLQHSANIDKLFPDTEASRTGKGTEAIPAVWEDREGFLAIAVELQKRSADLKKVAATNDQNQIRASFVAMAKTCGGCHQDYRKKKE